MGDEVAEINRLFSKEGNAIPFGGPKTCGGFHPDYMVEWTVGDARYRAHVCFGCGEIMVIGPGIDTLVDISDAASPDVEKALLVYRNRRPVD